MCLGIDLKLFLIMCCVKIDIHSAYYLLLIISVYLRDSEVSFWEDKGLLGLLKF